MHMAGWTRGVLFFRRISALSLFFVVLLLFLGLYYYKYVPANTEALNQRGHRMLTQLAENLNNRDHDLHAIFDSITCDNVAALISHSDAYGQLYDNIPFAVTTDPHADPRAGNPFFPLRRETSGDWSILYPDTTHIPRYTVEVGISSFAGPVLSSRSDLFNTYLLLVDTNRPASRKSSLLQVLYRQDGISSSEMLSADTLLSLQKNTDLSGICDLQIGGRSYKVFWVSFDFHMQHLLLAGLLAEEDYTQRVQSTPVNFLPTILILICLILISLPFLKAYLLSPGESVDSKDVLGTALSFYLGSATLCIIVFYSFFVYISELGWKNRLVRFSDSIYGDITRELEAANQQLDQYDTLTIPPTMIGDLTRPGEEGNAGDPINTICAPRIFKNMDRLAWCDSNGNTIAKWNPFDYLAPFTNLGSYTFFRLLQTQPPESGPWAGIRTPVVYPGKSNLTDEFYTFIAKYSSRRFDVTGADCKPTVRNRQAYSIGMAVMLHCSIHPIVPKGFGFCLIDPSGEILIDSDPRRNLQENLFEESGDAEGLRAIIRLKNPSNYFGMQLYGEPFTGRVLPISGQPLYLVCYYNHRILARNIFRFLHFAIGSLLCLYILLTICLAMATFREWKPTQLLFSPNKKEWIRPSSANFYAHAYTKTWFGILVVLALVFFGCIEQFTTGLNNIFYISLLLPFYAIWGFILSRQSSTLCRPEEEGKAMEPARSYVRSFGQLFTEGASGAIGVGIVNFICWYLVNYTRPSLGPYVGMTLFQLLALSALTWCHSRLKKDWMQKTVSQEKKEQMKGQYKWSLYLSILVLGLLPTLGVLTYGFYAEKIQFKKDKLLKMGSAFFNRTNYLETGPIPNYKSAVTTALGHPFLDSLIFRNSIYFYDQDTLLVLEGDNRKPKSDSATVVSGTGRQLPDALYSLLMDKVYLSSPVWGDDVSIQDSTGDGSWHFELEKTDSMTRIRYLPAQAVDTLNRHIELETGLQKPLVDIWKLSPYIKLFFSFLVLAMLILGKKLIDGMIDRLFLQDFSMEGKIEVIPGYLQQYLGVPVAVPDFYLKELRDLPEGESSFFEWEEKGFPVDGKEKDINTQQEMIMAMTDSFAPLYENLWKSLSPEEQYVLFDFSMDRYTNYKNSHTIFKLMNKGILIERDNVLDVFCRSYRQYVLLKKESRDIQQLKARFSAPGTWESIRIPIFVMIAVAAIFIVKTETNFTNSLIAVLTTLTTLLPLVLKIFAPSAPPEEKAAA